jgi:hypothetical protein
MMGEALYASYLLVLLLLPLLAQWRWGLRASLLVVVAELALVPLVLYLLDVLHLLPPPPPRRPLLPNEYGVLERMRQNDAEGFAHGIVVLALWVVFPAMVALAGGVLSLLWSTIQAIKRSFVNRQNAAPRT